MRHGMDSRAYRDAETAAEMRNDGIDHELEDLNDDIDFYTDRLRHRDNFQDRERLSFLTRQKLDLINQRRAKQEKRK